MKFFWIICFVFGCGGSDSKDSPTPETAIETGVDSHTQSPDPFQGAPQQALVLDNAWIVDVDGGRQGAVVVSGTEIWKEMSVSQQWPASWTVEDLGGKTVMPGLIDSHVHLFHSGATTWVGDTLQENLASTLAWGVLAVVDMGGPENSVSLRRRVETGSVLGPAMKVAGPFLTAVGSHPCESANDRDLCRYVDGDGLEQALALSESDFLKVALADYHFSPWESPRLALSDLADILSAGKSVVAHVSSRADLRDAAALGVDLFAHPPIDGAVADEDLAVNFRAMTTTLSAFRRPSLVGKGQIDTSDPLHRGVPQAVMNNWVYLDAHPEEMLSGWVAANATWADQARENVGAYRAQSAALLAGSDAGYYFVPHGAGLHLELEALVEAGFSPLEAIVSATSRSAETWGFEGRGRIAAGYLADLVVVRSNPLEDIRATREIEQILLGGVLTTPESIWSGAVWKSPKPATESLCLTDADCVEGCNVVDHLCMASCDAAWQVEEACDEESWCAPSDGMSSTQTGVCQLGDGCDWRLQDCAPSYYLETCIPADIDTSYCWPAGQRQQGQTCDWSPAGNLCAEGLYCSPVSSRCLTICDPSAADPGCPVGQCRSQYGEQGGFFFGLCY